jgi:hypothetical protein
MPTPQVLVILAMMSTARGRLLKPVSTATALSDADGGAAI